jgi:hypothetical protein
MTALDNVLAKVYTITNRPDLNVESTQAANRALRYSHMGRPVLQNYQQFPNSEFSFDLVEATFPVPIDTSTGSGFLNFVIALPARFRGPRFYYLYADPPVNNTSLNFSGLNTNKQLDFVPPGALFDRQALLKQADCYYIAGQNVSIRTSVSRKNIYWAYLQLPSFVDSFIANSDTFSDMIAWKAASEVFAMLDDNKKTYYEQLASQQLIELQTSYQII